MSVIGRHESAVHDHSPGGLQQNIRYGGYERLQDVQQCCLNSGDDSTDCRL